MKFVLRGLGNKKLILVQKIAWHQSDDKPLSELRVVLYADAYLHPQATMSQQSWKAFASY